MSFELKSSSFENGKNLPLKHTCDGENISPQLTWADAPAETQGYAIVCDDPDAPGGTFVHWIIYNIGSEINTLNENIVKEKLTKEKFKQGVNDFGTIGYSGPRPPKNNKHRYFFKLYALDYVPNILSGISKQELLLEIMNHILAETQLVGIYGR